MGALRFILMILALGLGLGTPATRAAEPLTNVDNGGLDALMARSVPLVDIRTRQEWAETGTVPGAKRITAFDETGRLAPDFVEQLAKVAGPGDEVALICRSGSRTAFLGRALTEKLGYGRVYNVEKGMNRWLAERRPVDKTP